MKWEELEKEKARVRKSTHSSIEGRVSEMGLLLMDIEKLLAKQRQMTGKPLSSTEDEGDKPSDQLVGKSGWRVRTNWTGL